MLVIGSADTGFADVIMQPDLETFRVVPWEEGVAAVVCDYATEAGSARSFGPAARPDCMTA